MLQAALKSRDFHVELEQALEQQRFNPWIFWGFSNLGSCVRRFLSSLPQQEQHFVVLYSSINTVVKRLLQRLLTQLTGTETSPGPPGVILALP